MNKSYLTKGIIVTLCGAVFLLAGILTESAYDALLWGFCGGTLVPGIIMIYKYFYWSSPERSSQYQELQEQEEINLNDELNEKLRDKSGRITYLIGIYITTAALVVFAVLGMAGIVPGYRIILLYLACFQIVQIVAGVLIYNHLRKKY